MLFRIQLILMMLGHNFSFSIFKSQEKAKDDSSPLRFLMNLKWQVLRQTFSFKESKRNKSDYSVDLDRGITKPIAKLQNTPWW